MELPITNISELHFQQIPDKPITGRTLNIAGAIVIITPDGELYSSKPLPKDSLIKLGQWPFKSAAMRSLLKLEIIDDAVMTYFENRRDAIIRYRQAKAILKLAGKIFPKFGIELPDDKIASLRMLTSISNEGTDDSVQCDLFSQPIN